MTGERNLLQKGFSSTVFVRPDSQEGLQVSQPSGLEPKKNGPQPLVEIEHDKSEVNDAFAGAGQFGHDPVQGAFAFGVAKFAFHGNAVDLVLSSLFLLGLECYLVFSGFFLRSSQGFS